MPAPFIALICAAPTMLNIAGVALPVDALIGAPKVGLEVARHAPTKQVVNDTLPIAGTLAASFIPIPCLGIAMQIAFFALGKSHRMTLAEERLWWARAQGVQ